MNTIYWLIAFVVLLVIEIFTMGLTTIWFAGGAIAAVYYRNVRRRYGGTGGSICCNISGVVSIYPSIGVKVFQSEPAEDEC